MERPTRTLQTPEGVNVVMKEYLNAREAREYRDIQLRHSKVGMGEDGKPTITGFDSAAVSQGEDFLIKTAVVSFDGKSENPLEALLESKKSEYDFVVEEARKLVAEANPTMPK